MKVAVKLDIVEQDTILTKIIVVDAKGFHTTRIFKSFDDYPSLPGYQFSPWAVNFIVNQFTDMAAAESWITQQIAALRAHFHKWYKDTFVSYYEVTL